jgi:hypothetical protein
MGGFFDAWTKCGRGELVGRGVLLISFGCHPEQARHVGPDKNDLLMEEAGSDAAKTSGLTQANYGGGRC